MILREMVTCHGPRVRSWHCPKAETSSATAGVYDARRGTGRVGRGQVQRAFADPVAARLADRVLGGPAWGRVTSGSRWLSSACRAPCAVRCVRSVPGRPLDRWSYGRLMATCATCGTEYATFGAQPPQLGTQAQSCGTLRITKSSRLWQRAARSQPAGHGRRVGES